MNTLREKSIKLLKEAVKNKSLGCYVGATNCRYYDSETDSRCAVGAIIPNEVIKLNLDEYGDCDRFIPTISGESVKDQLVGKTEYQGMSVYELIELQSLHDIIITKGSVHDTVQKFETYVNSLK